MMQNSNTSNTTPFHALIVAAGRGSRLESETPKQYIHIHGKPVLRHTIESFANTPGIQSITVVIHPDDEELSKPCAAGMDHIGFVHGGESRKASVYNGLNKLSKVNNEDIVLIHDAARPCITPQDILNLIDSLKTNKAATLALPVHETLRHENGEHISRDGLWAVQTPQGFRYGDIMRAHKNAEPDVTYTDDAGMAEAIGIPVALIQSSRHNIKITMKDDLDMAAKLLIPSGEIRTGTGFDVHAFELEDKTRKLILGGVEIEHEYGLKGHSDADVALHALTDALLGAMGEDDIGKHFPPSDDQFKNMDSAVFLQEAYTLLQTKGGTISNLDLTIIGEAPKIGPHRDKMKKRIAEILQLEESRINIKATTTEKLGFTGRGEGIAAQAVATIRM